MPRECEKALVELGFWLCELHDGLRWRKKDTPHYIEKLAEALDAVETHCKISVDKLGNEIVQALNDYREGDRKSAGKKMTTAKYLFRNLFEEEG